MSKLRISEITLTTKDGQYVRLTLDEARDLHTQLAELFGRQSVAPAVIERNNWPALWAPYRPTWTDPTMKDAPPLAPIITCDAPSGLTTQFCGVEL